jgi:tetratricopeptide (TPR) repeat protein
MFHDWNWSGARESVRRALELAPSSATALRLSGVLATILGETAEAIAIFRRALDQDPLSAAAYHSLGFALHAEGDHAAAEEAYRKALELAPQRVGTRSFLAQTLLAMGRLGEAAEEARQEPEDGFRLCAVAITSHALGNEAESSAALRQLIEKHADLWGLQVAEVHAARGDVDQAFDWLERAFARRDTGLARVMTNAQLRPLHGHDRWNALLAGMGLGKVAPSLGDDPV